jgi:hypothetical protein
MPNLITIFGPPAVGKAAVGHELAKLIGYRLFHNHLTVEPVAALLGWDFPRFGKVVEQLRLTLFRKAAGTATIPGVIFTFVWGLEIAEDRAFIDQLQPLFEASGGRTLFVELTADLDTRLAREGTPLRLSLKPSKRDVPASRQHLRDLHENYKLNTDGDFFYPDRHLVLNTQNMSATESAKAIAKYWTLTQ